MKRPCGGPMRRDTSTEPAKAPSPPTLPSPGRWPPPSCGAWQAPRPPARLWMASPTPRRSTPYAQTAMAWAGAGHCGWHHRHHPGSPVHCHPGPRRGPGDALRREIRKHSIPFWPPGLAPGGQITPPDRRQVSSSATPGKARRCRARTGKGNAAPCFRWRNSLIPRKILV